jgi:cysteine-rich repeat protein
MTPRPGHILYINSDLVLAANAWGFLSQFQAPAAVCGDGTRGAGEECDDGNVAAGDGCDAVCRTGPCGPAPEANCRGSVSVAAKLKLRDSADDEDDRFSWKWSRGEATAKNEFGNPATDEELWLCLYSGGELRSSTRLEAAADCGSEPCWKEASSGFGLRSDGVSTGGLTKVSLRAGESGKAKIGVKGAGAFLDMPGELAGTVVVQLKKTRHGVCWESAFEEPHQRNENGNFADTGY